MRAACGSKIFGMKGKKASKEGASMPNPTLTNGHIAWFRPRSRSSPRRSSSVKKADDLSANDPTSSTLEPEIATPIVFYDKTDLHYVICRKVTLDASDPDCTCSRMDEHTEFETYLLKRWDEAYKKKLFNYDLNLMYKLLPGRYMLTAQLNVERGTMRRKPRPFRHVEEPFDSRRFNYNKIKRKEVLLDMRSSDEPITTDPLDRHLLIINASPIERGHALGLCCVNRCTSQVMTRECIHLMTDIMLLSRSARLHLLYNSLLAFASVNHQHFHCLYWPYNPPIIKRPVRQLHKMVHFLQAPQQWFAPAYVVQLTKPEEKTEFIDTVHKVISYLLHRNVAHNMFWTRAPVLELLLPDGSEPAKVPGLHHTPYYTTAFIFPRKSVPGVKPLTKFSPAASELAGNLLIFSNRFFHTLSEVEVLRIVEEECALLPAVIDSLNKDLTSYLENGTLSEYKNDIVADLASLRLKWSSIGRYDQICEAVEMANKERSHSNVAGDLA